MIGEIIAFDTMPNHLNAKWCNIARDYEIGSDIVS